MKRGRDSLKWAIWEAPHERGRIFTLEVCERVGNFTPEVFERVGLSVAQPIQRA